MDKKEKTMLIIGAALVILVAAIAFSWSKVSKALRQVKKKVEDTAKQVVPPASGQPTPPAKTTVTYPVSPSSPADAIRRAFNDSGYMAALRTSVDQGIYPADYLTSAETKPGQWLASHSYLFTAYPAFFKEDPPR